MYSVIVQVKVEPNREDEVRKLIHDDVVPRAKQLPGFTSGVWLQALDGECGTAVLVFETEDAAGAAAERIRSEGPLAEAPVWTVQAVVANRVLAQA